MERRKIQLIAGSTYSISLPKPWVIKNNLKGKDEVLIFENDSATLTISAGKIKQKNYEDITLDAERYTNISQVLFGVYYMGIESVTILSKEDILKNVKMSIRKTVQKLSGTEIVYEDKKKIVIKSLLDKSKIKLTQLLYRTYLIIDSSLTNVIENFDIKEISENEAEVDRLYHLATQILKLSLVDSSILQTSQIERIFFIPSFFMINKRLEKIHDDLYRFSIYYSNAKNSSEHIVEILKFAKSRLRNAISFMLKKTNTVYQISNGSELDKINDLVSRVEDRTLLIFLTDLMKHIKDIEEEIVNLSFYMSIEGVG